MNILAYSAVFIVGLLLLISLSITLGNTVSVLTSLFNDDYKDRKGFIEDLIWPLKLYRNYKKLPSSYEESQIGFRILK